MDGFEIIRAVESSGGSLWVDGDFIGYRIPKRATGILPQIRDRKNELLRLLQDRPPTVRGVRIIRWEPVNYPVQIDRWTTVTNSRRFATKSLLQIKELLAGGTWHAGNWTLSQLVERLKSVGVTIEIEDQAKLVQ
ncbi:hypothetical protein [Edaphobacter modestus]|uniref:TubC N-terminal docking domain-containing protein n=1 Tax=Edaphobacter modestus TaxID=388466 RepID=A0A4Q7Z048_9BACT|nr:hypothetical protein [Edaphobacter modestus]RZU43458.1 hypothetical protein BDD14_5122 [Edaphobacter modestus]